MTNTTIGLVIIAAIGLVWWWSTRRDPDEQEKRRLLMELAAERYNHALANVPDVSPELQREALAEVARKFEQEAEAQYEALRDLPLYAFKENVESLRSAVTLAAAWDGLPEDATDEERAALTIDVLSERVADRDKKN